jgi:hypothetical protein
VTAAPDPTNVPSPSPRGRRSLAKAFTILVTVFGAVVLIGGGWWIFPYWQKSHADTHAAEAEDFLESRSYGEAEAEVEKALKMRPGDSRYLRLAARIYAIDHNPKAIGYFQALLRTVDATERDRYDFIELALLLKRPELVTDLINQMVSAQGVSAKTQFYAAMLAEARGDIPEAIKLARAAVAQDAARDDPKQEGAREHRLLLGRVLVASGDKEKIEEGKKILLELAARRDRARLPAIRALAATDLSTNNLQQLVRWLKVTPLFTLDDLFLGYDFLYRLDTNNVQRLGRDVAEKFTSNRPDEQIALGKWLNSHQLFDQTLKSIKPDEDLKNTRIAAIYLDALIGAGKWEEALKFAERLERAGGKDEARAAYQRLASNAVTAAAATADLERLRGATPAKTGAQ